MKKSLFILLTLIFLFNIGGYYFWFSYRQYSIQKLIRKEIRKGLKDEDLTLFVIPVKDANEIDWIKSGKEFRYNGKMYDVVKTFEKDQKTYYRCINDTKEKQLIENYVKNDKHRKKEEQQIKRVISNSFIPQYAGRLNKLFGADFHYPAIIYLLETGDHDIPSPPPKA